jgi:hypothetical protein
MRYPACEKLESIQMSADTGMSYQSCSTRQNDGSHGCGYFILMLVSLPASQRWLFKFLDQCLANQRPAPSIALGPSTTARMRLSVSAVYFGSAPRLPVSSRQARRLAA